MAEGSAWRSKGLTAAAPGPPGQRRHALEQVIRRLAQIAVRKSPFRVAMPEDYRQWHSQVQTFGRRLQRHIGASGQLEGSDMEAIDCWIEELSAQDKREKENDQRKELQAKDGKHVKNEITEKRIEK